MVVGAGKMGTGDETSSFFSESILHTEHDGVRPYVDLVTGLLLEISRQAKMTDRPGTPPGTVRKECVDAHHD